MYLVVCKLQHHPFNKEKKNICQFHGITLLSIFNENTRLSSLMRCFSFIITGSPWIIEEQYHPVIFTLILVSLQN
jgi:hypothetical protein